MPDPKDSKATLIGHAAARYNQLSSEREEWIDAAERFAAITLPSVMPPEGRAVPDRKIVPHNNTGAQGVNTLASKMNLQLLPPQQAFFRMELKPEAKKLIRGAAGSEDPGVAAQGQAIEQELQSSLVDLEQRLLMEIGRDNVRSNAGEAFKQLLVVGNVLLHIPEKGATSVVTLRNFVVKRDPAGNVLNIVMREQVAEVALTPQQRHAMGLGDALSVPQSPEPSSAKPSDATHKTIDIFTVAERTEHDSYEMWQEVNGAMVSGSWGKYKEGDLPLIPLRWTETAEEDYGHAYVGDFEGDLMVLEGLSKAIKEAAMASSRVLFGVSKSAPVGLENQLSSAPNGAFRRFDDRDISVLQVNKMADLSMASQTAQEAQMRLRQAFLLNSTRNAERVTAEEIRLNFQELQAALGGAFAQLANTFQVPLLRRLMIRLKARGGLKGIEDAVTQTEPVIITGVDALGRNVEMGNMLAFTDGLQRALGPQTAAMVLKPHEVAKRMANATNVKPEGMVRSEQEFAQMQQQSSMQTAFEKGAGPTAAAAIRAGTVSPPQGEA